MKEMAKKGVNFYVSGHLWNIHFRLWEKKQVPKKVKLSMEHYFRVAQSLHSQFSKCLGGSFITDNTAEMIANIWGGVFIYEFLSERNLVDEKGYQDFLESTKKIKGSVISEFYFDSWIYDFVHHWNKSNSITVQEFEQEKKLFRKSYDLTEHEESVFDYFKEEMTNIGELADYIKEAEEEFNKNMRP